MAQILLFWGMNRRDTMPTKKDKAVVKAPSVQKSLSKQAPKEKSWQRVQTAEGWKRLLQARKHEGG